MDKPKYKNSERKKAQMRARMAERRKDPEFREQARLKSAAYSRDPAWRARRKKPTPEQKAKYNEARRLKRLSDPSHSAKEKAHKANQAVKDRANELRRKAAADPLKRAKKDATRREWASRPEVAAALKARSDAYCKSELGRIARMNAANRRRAREGDHRIPTPALRGLYAASKKCPYCGLRYSKTRVKSMDHTVPLAKGGTHSIENITICCFPCNNKKRALLPDQWAQTIGLLFI